MKETMIDKEVTYTVEHDGKFFLIERVPARVCRETGEQFFAPETVEHIHAVINSRKKPLRTIETPVYKYA
jgi:YgiT-type zinc finger domain-containing protein